MESYLRILKISVLASLMLIMGIVLYLIFRGVYSLSEFLPKLLITTTIISIAYFLGCRILNNQKVKIERLSKQQATFLDSIDIAYVDVAIFLSAGVSLFLELSVIRWQSTVFPIFAFYKNFSLLACFAGLGLGYALAKRESIPLFLSIPVLVSQMLLLIFIKYGIGLVYWSMATPITEQLTPGLRVANTIPMFVATYSFLLVVFLVTALAFIPIGQLCGRLMIRRNNLRAYGFNLLGGVFGIISVFGASFLWTPPVVWFSICFIFLLVFQIFDLKVLFTGIFFSLVSVITLSWPVSVGFERIYSPYQLLELGPGSKCLMTLRSAGIYFQEICDLSLSSDNQYTKQGLQHIADHYELPYMIYKKKPQNVAIVGAGVGNDVAAALRQGSGKVDAIEIDPAVLKLGNLYHPEMPYHDTRVNSIINDARTFFRTNNEKYDMIVYGLLGSLTLLSHASSVRLDSFVYTVEGLKDARARLKEGGLLSLSFSFLSDQIGRKIYLMMQKAFEGVAPVCIKANGDGPIIFLQDKEGELSLDENIFQENIFEDVTDYYGNPKIKANISTDDWPFFYMPVRTYPISCLGLLALILVMSFSMTLNFFRQVPALGSPIFFFLGAGFMLIETKAITEMGLAFGNTWHVIGIVISGILFMAFLANCFVSWLNISKPTLPFILLFLSLMVGFVVSIHGGFPSSSVGKMGTTIVLTCPIFFSGMVFSSILSRAKDISGIMAINLIGAMVGGVLEYNSMYFGFSFLYLLAIFLYLIAMVSYTLRGYNNSVLLGKVITK
jgi:hypothetical protein